MNTRRGFLSELLKAGIGFAILPSAIASEPRIWAPRREWDYCYDIEVLRKNYWLGAIEPFKTQVVTSQWLPNWLNESNERCKVTYTRIPKFVTPKELTVGNRMYLDNIDPSLRVPAVYLHTQYIIG